jgi:hypothetical protein
LWKDSDDDDYPNVRKPTKLRTSFSNSDDLDKKKSS